MTNEEIKECLLKELIEAYKCFEESTENNIETYWEGYTDALEWVIRNLFGKEEK